MSSKWIAVLGLAVSLVFAKDAPSTLPQISLPNVEGKVVSSAEWKGKVVVIDFWATWCMACREAFPVLSELQTKYGNKLVVVGISTDKASASKTSKFISKQKLGYLVLLDPEEKYNPIFGFESLPSLYVFGADGKLLLSLKGLEAENKKKLEEVLSSNVK